MNAHHYTLQFKFYLAGSCSNLRMGCRIALINKIGSFEGRGGGQRMLVGLNFFVLARMHWRDGSNYLFLTTKRAKF